MTRSQSHVFWVLTVLVINLLWIYRLQFTVQDIALTTKQIERTAQRIELKLDVLELKIDDIEFGVVKHNDLIKSLLDRTASNEPEVKAPVIGYSRIQRRELQPIRYEFKPMKWVPVPNY